MDGPGPSARISSIRVKSLFTRSWFVFTRSLNFAKSISVPSRPLA